jgi:hypothetical protein
LRIGNSRYDDICFQVRGADFGAGDQGIAGVRDLAGDGAAWILGEERKHERERNTENSHLYIS